CSDETIARLIDPWLADLRHEHAEAIAGGHRFRAIGVRVAYGAAFVRLMASALVHADGLARMLAWQAVAVAASTALFVLPPYLEVARAFRGGGLILLWYLVPQALMVGLTLGVVIGLIFSLRRGRPSPELRAAAIVVACGCAIATGALDSAVLPRANQTFRETSAARLRGHPVRLQRGFNEMSPFELWRDSSPLSKRRLFQRAALTAAPLALIPCLVGLLTFRRGRLSSTVVVAAYYCYFGFGNALLRGSSSPLQTFLIIWAPNLAMMFVSATARLGDVTAKRAS